MRIQAAPAACRAPCDYQCSLRSIRQHTSAYVSLRVKRPVAINAFFEAYVSIRQHASAYVSLHVERLVTINAVFLLLKSICCVPYSKTPPIYVCACVYLLVDWLMSQRNTVYRQEAGHRGQVLRCTDSAYASIRQREKL
jgi:hypothetical protein